MNAVAVCKFYRLFSLFALAGLLLEIKGEFPQLHETLHCNGIAFEVMQRNQHRIVKIKVVAPAACKDAE